MAVELVSEDFDGALDLLRAAGFRLDSIYPADAPATALLSRDGQGVALKSPGAPPLADGLPAFTPRSVLARADQTSVNGRAGMLYRDLIPGRLGGRYVASHITIPEGGPVSDWVHFHRVALQLIVVIRGWVRVVYEDQGEPFVMEAGDLVLQPPGIRHRVLESSPGLEVIEIGAPAVHETLADHELALPNGIPTGRDFGGQSFLRHVAAEAPWREFDGGEAQETGIRQATGGLANVRTVRPGAASHISFAPHDGELVFGFVTAGAARLEHGDGFDLAAADAFVVPPADRWTLAGMSADFRLLHVTTARLS